MIRHLNTIFIMFAAVLVVDGRTYAVEPPAPLPAITEVALDPPPDGAVIRYTLDGRKPSKRSPVYCRPIRLAKSATIRTVVFRGEERLAEKAITCKHAPTAEESLSGRAVAAVNVDYHEVPELAEWAEKVRRDAEAIYPRMARVFGSKGYVPPRQVLFTFKKDMKGVAGTSGRRVAFAASWIKSHPDDYGCAIHELAHVVQSYPRYDPVWLIEALADYVRFWIYEDPSRRPRPKPEKVRVKDTYQRGAAFLAWLAETRGENIITDLSAAIRELRYEDELFKEYTGKTLEELTEDFRRSLRDTEQAPMRGVKPPGGNGQESREVMKTGNRLTRTATRTDNE